MTTKVKLSAKELALVSNAQFILTKNSIIAKVYALMAQLNQFYVSNYHQAISLKHLPTQLPKIARGENYQGLPWVMLDYPRIFGKENTFAIRTFFWWGNFVSITLQLQGCYQKEFGKQIEQYFNENITQGWFISCGKNAWQHDFEKSNYLLVEDCPYCFEAERPFIKLAKKIPLQEWDNIEGFLQTTYTEIMQMFTHPNGETSL